MLDVFYHFLELTQKTFLNYSLNCLQNVHLICRIQESKIPEPKVYNVTSTGTSNTRQLGDYMADMYSCRDETVKTMKILFGIPIIQLPATYTRYVVYKILDFFLHLIPGTIADLALKVSGNKLRLLPIYRQIRTIANVISFAILRTKIFMCTNMSNVYIRYVYTNSQYHTLIEVFLTLGCPKKITM